MKRKLVVFIVCSLFAMRGFAQKYYTSDPSGSVILMAGFNSSNLHSDTANYESIKTPVGGLMYSYVVSERFNINMGAMYVAKGYKNEKLHEKHRHFYLDMPVYLQYKLGTDLRFDLGAQYSLFANATTTFLDGDKSSGQNSVRHKNALKTTDAGMIAGMELTLSNNFDIAVRYTRSFSAFQGATGFSSFQLHLHYHMVKFYGRGKKREDTPQ